MIGSGGTKDLVEREKMGQIGNVESPTSYFDSFLQTNRLDEISALSGHLPQYMESFRKSHNFLLRGDGPLPYYCRHYIAIMASARHRCKYLLSTQRLEYLCVGGEEEWLKSIKVIPQRLKQLEEINKLLAHCPWSLNGSHIETLMKGKGNWCLSELIHAIVLLCHFHALSGLVWGCDLNAKHRPTKFSQEDRRAKVVNHANTPSEGSISTRDEFECSDKKSDDLYFFVDDSEYDQHDTCRREKSPDVLNLRVQDCSWEKHGFSLLNRLYGDAGNFLDDRFRQCSRNTGSRSWTTAVWNYVQCIFGIKYDDFDYNQINSILSKHSRSYIKTLCCHPERINEQEVGSISDSKYSEQVHLNVIILEARLQSELLYALRAVMQYMASS